jgi:hypothetical protein
MKRRGRKGYLWTLCVDYIRDDDLDAVLTSNHPLRSVRCPRDFLTVAATFRNGETFRFHVVYTGNGEFFVMQDGDLTRVEPWIPNHDKDAPLLTEIVDATFRDYDWQAFESFCEEPPHA